MISANIATTPGALGSWGAALLEPYSDKPNTRGLMLHSREALSKLVKQFWKDGWQVVCLSQSLTHIFLTQQTLRTSTVSVIEQTTLFWISSKNFSTQRILREEPTLQNGDLESSMRKSSLQRIWNGSEDWEVRGSFDFLPVAQE